MEFVFLILAIAVAAGDEECQVPPSVVQCEEPRTQMQLTGFLSSAPLFHDSNVRARCVGKSKNLLVKESTKEIFEPFSGKISCNENEVITGIELCFQVELKYIAPSCTRLEAGYRLNLDNVQAISNRPEMPHQILCPDDMALISLELQEDENASDINAFGVCASVIES